MIYSVFSLKIVVAIYNAYVYNAHNETDGDRNDSYNITYSGNNH